MWLTKENEALLMKLPEGRIVIFKICRRLTLRFSYYFFILEHTFKAFTLALHFTPSHLESTI